MSTSQIISVSRRTDVPAFYADWFMRRIRAGFCMYPNPFVPRTVYRVDLRADAVAGLVFWTRNARPLMPWLAELDRAGYACYFLYSLLGYPRYLEPRSPSFEAAAETFRELSCCLGRERVLWRYDPLILDDRLTPEWHLHNVERCLAAIGGHTQRMVLSIVDPYRKTQRHLRDSGGGDTRYAIDDYRGLVRDIATRVRRGGMTVQTCAEPALTLPNVVPGACVDAARLARIAGQPVRAVKHRQRTGCLCDRSVDIGVNNTCGFGCRYCYATRNHEKAAEHVRNHDPEWSSIVGNLDPSEPSKGMNHAR